MLFVSVLLKGEQMSAQFRHEEYAERLEASMMGEGGQQLVVGHARTGQAVLQEVICLDLHVRGQWAPPLFPLQEKKPKDLRSRQVTMVADMKETTATMLALV